MRTGRRSIVAVYALVLAMVISQRSGAQSADEQAVRSARAAQNEAIGRGDVGRIAEFWTDDVSIRRGLGQLVVGRDAYRKLFERAARGDSALVYQRDPTSVAVSTRWPLAYERGVWMAHLGRLDGPVVIRGQYSAQWVKRGERWLIRSEVYVALACEGVGCAFAAVP